MSSYLERRGAGRPDGGRGFGDFAPKVEIIGEFGRSEEEELPEGTRIITHPLQVTKKTFY